MSQEKAAEIIELNAPRSGDGAVRATDVAAAGETAGAALAAARKAAGLGHGDVSSATNIKTEHLAAIEASDRGALPAIPFAVGFVKTYANFLGLDAEALAQQFRNDISADAPVEDEIEEKIIVAPSYASDGARLVSLLGIGVIVVFVIWITFQIAVPKNAGVASEARADAQRVTLGTAPAGAALSSTVPVEDVTPEIAAPPAAVATAAEDRTGEEAPVAPADIVPSAPILAAAPEEIADQEPAQPAIAEPGIVNTPPAEAYVQAIPDIIEPAPDVTAAALNDAQAREMPTPLQAQEALAPAPIVRRDRAPDAREDTIINARLTRSLAPRYPDKCARNADAVETVAVDFDVTARGRIANARVVSSTNSCFNAAAIATIGRWRFDPRTVNGQPRPDTGIRATLNFER